MAERRVMVQNEAHGERFALYQADCVELAKQLPGNSIDYSVYSPPFASLYIYSESEADLGNCENDVEFFEQYGFLARELHRITKPGRTCSVHCKDLVDYKGRDGRAGLRDFPGELIKSHEAAGWKYHSRVTVWKDPVIEMQRTKAHGLLYKQLRADSTFSRQGMAEYVLTFRKWAEEDEEVAPVTHTKDDFPLDQWQQWASPVWMDIQQTNVLNIRQARTDHDEKHICPLQLDLVERCIVLWSNRNDVVFSPFTGIGSEGVIAIKHGRRFIGTELKDSYFAQAAQYLRAEESSATDLFRGVA